MARKRPEGRLDELVQCAAHVFTERGYRRTQMADVARALGVAPGTLYLYVESKEALFDLVTQRAFLHDPPAPPQLPLPTPPQGTMLRHVRERFAREMHLSALDAALRRRKPSDMRDELDAIVRELFRVLLRNWRGVKLIERSALDWPQLSDLFVEMRRDLIANLTLYLQRRLRQGLCRPQPNAEVGARLIIETVAWFALHRHRDADSGSIDDHIAEETVVTVLLRGFAKGVRA